MESEIDRITGKETGASVDSELSMVLFSNYELYRWRPNLLNNHTLHLSLNTLMVCRLEGPDQGIIKGLIEKALKAEKTGLKGIAYIDSRGIAEERNLYSTGYFDQSLRDLAALIGCERILMFKKNE